MSVGLAGCGGKNKGFESRYLGVQHVYL